MGLNVQIIFGFHLLAYSFSDRPFGLLVLWMPYITLTHLEQGEAIYGI